MKIVFALLVLATCVSARFTISKIKADDGPCNVTLPAVSADMISHFPERRTRLNGTMFWDNVMERFAIIGYEESPRGDAEYGFYQYFRQYTDTIRIDARTEFVLSTVGGVTNCHKFPIRTGFNYRPPGIPNDYTCIGDFVQGWKDQSHNDGVSIRFCSKKDNGTEYSFRTATSKLCYPVSHSTVNFLNGRRAMIQEETDYYNWEQIAASNFPRLPQACTV
eukprot:TRINITY_DN58_c0_g1_i1.p1 TRINITY_DN58_c0_g1~~TRINITY_DN58_c0_g1_i1.p1  ORF type:complete len:220 (-),score=-1.70 TRINITY_DN58_c0_g1_i1:166-825(-)